MSQGERTFADEIAAAGRGTSRPHPAVERHYSAQEIADMWGISVQYVRRLFEHMDGVLRLNGPSITGRRRYVTLRIPESVVMRVHHERSRGVVSEFQRGRGAVKY